jgi:hypothetical protein
MALSPVPSILLFPFLALLPSLPLAMRPEAVTEAEPMAVIGSNGEGLSRSGASMTGVADDDDNDDEVMALVWQAIPLYRVEYIRVQLLPAEMMKSGPGRIQAIGSCCNTAG